MARSFNMDEAFTKVLSNIKDEHQASDGIRSKKAMPTEQDFLLMAFMSLLRAYMLRVRGKDNASPPVFMMGA